LLADKQASVRSERHRRGTRDAAGDDGLTESCRERGCGSPCSREDEQSQRKE
jgi:hypothetical protein